MLVDSPYEITLEGLHYRARHGALASEQTRAQPFRVDVSLTYEPGEIRDRLQKVVDYSAVERVVAQIMSGASVRLIETLADTIAAALLERFPAILSVTVTIHKPEAPLATKFADVIVRRTRRRIVTAYLGLGSNLGDRRRHLQQALRGLAACEDVRLRAISSLYRSAPVGGVKQADFYNAVVAIETALPPSRLLACCKRLEGCAGRLPGERWGPRPLDLDILLCGNLVMSSEALTIPHPRLPERAFVLRPLAELAPELIVPGGQAVAALCDAVRDQGVERIAPPDWAATDAAPAGDGGADAFLPNDVAPGDAAAADAGAGGTSP